MESISQKLTQEIERRVAAGPFRSADELLAHALKAMDDAQAASQEWLELELLKGLEGEGKVMTPADWDDIERKAMERIASRKS